MALLQEQQNHSFGSQIYKMLPERYRTNDHSFIIPENETERMGFVERFCRVFGDTYDAIKERYGGLLDYHNPMSAPESILKYISMKYGWPLDDSLDDGFKRLLIRNVEEIYKYAGRVDSFWYIIYLHTGITVYEYQMNRKGTVVLNYRTILSGNEDAGAIQIEVEDVGSLRVGDAILVNDGYYESFDVITGISGNVLSLKYGLTFPERKGAEVVRDLGYSRRGRLGMSGFRGFKFGESRLSIHRIYEGDVGLYDDDGLHSLETSVIEWPYEPDDNVKNLAMFLIDYLKPPRSNYIFTYRTGSSTLYFTLNRSRLGLNDIIGGS